MPNSGNLRKACELVAAGLGMTVPFGDKGGGSSEDIHRIVSALGLRARRVQLAGDWWRCASGPMVAWLGDDVVALMPGKFSGYDIVHPVSAVRRAVNAELAQNLAEYAYSLCEALPRRAVLILDLVRLAWRGNSADATRALLLGALSGMAGLVAPLAMRHLFGSAIPGQERSQLWLLACLAFVGAGCAALLRLAASLQYQRIGTRMGSAAQAALWDRVLSLPTAALSRYSPADLASRIAAVDQMQHTFITGLAVTFIACLFSFFHAALIFLCSPVLGCATVALTGALVFFSAAGGLRIFRLEQQASTSEAEVSQKGFEYVQCIQRLRAAAAEYGAFTTWLDSLARFRHNVLRCRNVEAVCTATRFAGSMIPWILLISPLASALKVADLVAVSASLQELFAASLQLSGLMLTAGRLWAGASRLRPLLKAVPEPVHHDSCSPLLGGSLELRNVSFRYQPDQAPVLSEISMRIARGEFIAIVGASGSGKSTLLRLLLGFEQPTTGSILFDGIDQKAFDPQALRQQFGVVLQSSRILPGSILSNILGTSAFNVDDAWRAAELAGIAGEIRALPMGMHTQLPEGKSGLSGGQLQRLLIARALVSHPEILLLDEATSALDNQTQSEVMTNLRSLGTTRIVIAHRMSTIREADRIYVLKDGRITECSSYHELANSQRAFREGRPNQQSGHDADTNCGAEFILTLAASA